MAESLAERPDLQTPRAAFAVLYAFLHGKYEELLLDSSRVRFEQELSIIIGQSRSVGIGSFAVTLLLEDDPQKFSDTNTVNWVSTILNFAVVDNDQTSPQAKVMFEAAGTPGQHLIIANFDGAPLSATPGLDVTAEVQLSWDDISVSLMPDLYLPVIE